MKIYCAHATSFDYKQEFYEPIKNSELWNKNNFILPHDSSALPIHSKEIIQTCDLFIAEVSYPSTGLGIELGWANIFNRKILCVAKENAKVSSAINFICADILLYSDHASLIEKLYAAFTIDINL